MLEYTFDLSLAGIIVAGLLLLVFGYQLYFYFRYIGAVLNVSVKQSKKKIVSDDRNQPPVSVIICAKDELPNLKENLPLLLAQHYPHYEVIVVNDGSVDDTEIYLNEMKKIHANLRSTFVPIGATNLSTKKLALTLGIKAAQHECLLFTDADCKPKSKFWIAKMVRNFKPGVEFVLGYGAYQRDNSFLHSLISYDTFFNALQFMGFALNGRPYMGVGRNLVYRKEMFFRQNGFSSTLHLRSGDDDLIVNHNANKRNTRVEIHPQSVTSSQPEKTLKDWFYQKERHLSVSSYYTAHSRRMLSFEPMTRGLFYLMLIAVSVTGGLYGVLFAALLYVVRLSVQLTILNKSAKYYGERAFVFSVLLFDIFLPLVNLYLLVFGRMGAKSRNIHWK